MLRVVDSSIEITREGQGQAPPHLGVIEILVPRGTGRVAWSHQLLLFTDSSIQFEHIGVAGNSPLPSVRCAGAYSTTGEYQLKRLLVHIRPLAQSEPAQDIRFLGVILNLDCND